MSWRVTLLSLSLLALSCLHCSDDDDTSESEDSSEAIGTPPTPTTNQNKVYLLKGVLQNPNAAPARGAKIWVIDHTSTYVHSLTCDPQGAFYLALVNLTKDHTYSLHAVSANSVYLAPVDLDPSQSGVQASFQVNQDAQADADMGVMTLALTSEGELDARTPTITAKPGSALTLVNPDPLVAINDLPLPGELTGLTWSTSLGPTSAVSLTEAFYQATANPTGYGSQLKRFAYQDLRLTLAAGALLSSATVAEGGSWLTAARLRSADALLPEAEALWSTALYGFSSQSTSAWFGKAYASALLPERSAVIISVQLRDGKQYRIPRLFKAGVYLPPMVNAFALGSSDWQTIDYSDHTAINALTNPVALANATSLSLRIEPAKDSTGTAYTRTDLTTLRVDFKYFADATPTSVAATDYSDTSLQAPLASTASELAATAAWDPATTTITYTLGEASATTDTLTLPAAYFLFDNANLGITRVRVRLRYTGSRNEAETFVWVVKG